MGLVLARFFFWGFYFGAWFGVWGLEVLLPWVSGRTGPAEEHHETTQNLTSQTLNHANTLSNSKQGIMATPKTSKHGPCKSHMSYCLNS